MGIYGWGETAAEVEVWYDDAILFVALYVKMLFSIESMDVSNTKPPARPYELPIAAI